MVCQTIAFGAIRPLKDKEGIIMSIVLQFLILVLLFENTLSALDSNESIVNIKNDTSNIQIPSLKMSRIQSKDQTSIKYSISDICVNSKVKCDSVECKYIIIFQRKGLKPKSYFINGADALELGDIYYFIRNRQKEWAIIETNGEFGATLFVVEIDGDKLKELKQSHYDYVKYTPDKLLKQDKYLPITYTMFEKDGGLYLRVGSTYKSDVITLKKPAEGK